MDQYLERLQHAIASSIRGVTPQDAVRHCDGKWSIAEILEHLYLTYTGTTKGCERSLQGTLARSAPTLKQRLSTVVVVTCGHMPTGRKASERNSPKGLPAEQVLTAIGPQIATMDAALTRCLEHFGASAKFMNHPVLGPLNIVQWQKFHWVHGRHHVRQILKLRENWAQEQKAPGTPGA